MLVKVANPETGKSITVDAKPGSIHTVIPAGLMYRLGLRPRGKMAIGTSCNVIYVDYVLVEVEFNGRKALVKAVVSLDFSEVSLGLDVLNGVH